jgi:hypothetical protein
MRMRVLILVALASIPAAVAAAQVSSTTPSGTTTQSGSSPQQLFAGVIVDDPKTSSTIRKLLTSKAGYIDPSPLFADLTGDGKSDAVVGVDDGGTAGTIAFYVLSADGSKNGSLKVVYHNQALYRAWASLNGTVLTVSNPHWAAGDDLWAPKKIVQKTYLWKGSAHTLVRTGTATIDGPKTVTTVVGGTTTPTTPTTPAG